MEIFNDKAVLIKTRNPQKYTVIPKSKIVQDLGNGGYQVAVYFGLDEMRVLRNLGVKDVVSPIIRNYNWPGRFKPMAHQVETASFLTLHRRAFCFNEPGTGKTLSALWAADYLMRRGDIRRVLILCPLSIMHSAWMGDITNSIMHRSAVVAHHAKATRRIELVQGDYEFVVTNYEGLNLIHKEVAADGRFDLVIVDEANAYKNPSTQRWKSLQSIIKPETYLWMMTGTPASQSPLDAYGLAKFVNPSGVPNYYSAWRDKVMVKVTQFKWAPRKEAKDIVHNALQPAIRFTKEQCLDLPPVITMTRNVPMSAQQTKYYKILKEQMLVHAAGETISAVNAGVMVSKLLQVSCIAYNTPVLTDKGWVPIQEVRKKDLVWDGCEFVRHEGLLPRGLKSTVVCFGVRMTPDHEVMTNSGWKKAEEVLYGHAGKRFKRAKVWLPDSAIKERYERWGHEEGAVAMSVRLRAAGYTGEPVSAFETPLDTSPLRMSTREQDTCNGKNTPVSNMGEHEKALLKPKRQGLEKLRRAGSNCLRQLGAKFRGFLGRHAEHVSAQSIFGSHRQQRPVLQTELSLGNKHGTVQQYAQHGVARHPKRANDVRASSQSVQPSISNIGRTLDTLRLAASESVDDSREVKVFDIAHCGPRNRFVVMGEDGQPLIVHNCGAAYSDGREVVEFDASARLNVLMEALEETDRKVLIFALFRSSIDTIAKHLESQNIRTAQIHGDINATRRAHIISDFQNTDNVRVLIMQPQATAHGITLTAADTVVFYGPLMSVEMYLQCIARADRKGQNASKVTVIHIQSSPIEEKMFNALAGKVDDHSLLVKLFDNEVKKS